MLSRKFVDDVEKVSRSLMKMSRRCREDVEKMLSIIERVQTC